MIRKNIYERLNIIFRDIFDDDSITVFDETTAEDITDWDSLMHITLISAVESEFNLRFEMKDVLSMKNVGEMVDILERTL